MMELFIIERRIPYGKTEDSSCFISNNYESILEWLKDNSDFDSRKSLWYWVVLKCILNDPDGPKLHKIYNWNAIEISRQPRSENDFV